MVVDPKERVGLNFDGKGLRLDDSDDTAFATALTEQNVLPLLTKQNSLILCPSKFCLFASDVTSIDCMAFR